MSETKVINDGFAEAVELADQLENEVADMDLGLTYSEITKMAYLVATKVKTEIPMYSPIHIHATPKWKLWDKTVEILYGRINDTNQ